MLIKCDLFVVIDPGGTPLYSTIARFPEHAMRKVRQLLKGGDDEWLLDQGFTLKRLLALDVDELDYEV